MKEEKNILTDWFYKPYQLCQTKTIKVNKETGEQFNAPSNVFSRRVFNIFLQATYNHFIETETLTSDSVIEIPLCDFMDKMNIKNVHNLKRSIESVPSMSVVTLHSKVSFGACCLIPYAQVILDRDVVEFRADKILVNMITSGFKLISANGDMVLDVDKKKNSMYYARMNLNISKELKNNEHKIMAFYEYLVSVKKTINDKSKLSSIKLETFLSMMECESYTKNSQIIKILENLDNRLEEVFGVKLYYKCNCTRAYNKISTISIMVYMSDNKDIDKMALNSNVLKDDKQEQLLFFEYKSEDSQVFRWKSYDKYKFSIDNKLTNVLEYSHKTDTKLVEKLEELL